MDNRLSILDYLNDDCMKAVLDYVPTREVILSERVSWRWQTIVLDYLRTAHIGVKRLEQSDKKETPSKTRWLKLRDTDFWSFARWTNKLGPSVVAACCFSEESLKVVGENCPNLKAVTFFHLSDELLLNTRNEIFRNLQRLCFYSCNVSDYCATQFISSDALEELEIHADNQITGECFADLKSNKFKSLILMYCFSLESNHLYLSADRLVGLTKLVLMADLIELPENIYLLLGKTSKLEQLVIYNARDRDDRQVLIKSVCRLKHLKYLKVKGKCFVTDEDLETLAHCCPELQSLHFKFCHHVTGRGLASLCATLGAHLTELGVRGSLHFTDDDVVACVRACPNLELMSVTGHKQLSIDAELRANAARKEMRAHGVARKPCRIRIDYQSVARLNDNFGGIADIGCRGVIGYEGCTGWARSSLHVWNRP